MQSLNRFISDIFSKEHSLEKMLIILLLIFLLASRIEVYLLRGSGSYDNDAVYRYFPQTVELSKSFKNFFLQTGPVYSAFLLFFERITRNIIVWPVISQHIFGIITALLVFSFLKNINVFLGFTVSLMVFTSCRSVIIEHTILREALTTFILMLLVYKMFGNKENCEIPSKPFIKGLLLGSLSLVLFLIRIEYLVLIGFLPFLFIYCTKKYKNPNNNIPNKKIVKYLIGYFLPIVLIFFINVSVSKKFKVKQYSGSVFNIAYHSLIPDVFYYKNSNYPELLKSYQNILKEHKAVSGSMLYFYDATDNYLEKHPNLNYTRQQMMDKLFLEIIRKNPIKYAKSYIINFGNQILGLRVPYVLSEGRKVLSNKLIDFFMKIFTIPTFYFNENLVNKIVVLLGVGTFPFILWNFNKLPLQIFVAIFIVFIHITLLSFIANATVRFRYPVDNFLYSIPLYMIYLGLTKFKYKFIKRV